MSYSNKSGKDISLSKNNVAFYSTLGQFLRNDHHNFVVQKSEKLASALYIVTGFISEQDPLRQRLRVCAVELVSASINPPSASSNDIHREQFSSQCMEIGTILSLAEKAGLVSTMNAKILCDEYGSLASFVKAHYDKVFNATPLTAESTRTKVQPEIVSKTDNKGHKDVSIKDIVSSVPKESLSDKKEDRRKKILEILNVKDKITINDASSAIPECSEKTVQRELTDLVREGVLIKEGERRWSTYRLAF